MHVGWRWATSAGGAWRQRDRFNDVRAYCLFLGHGRSGHSVVGAMLDAHPDIILSDELDALKYIGMGFSRNQLLALSAKVAADQARSHRQKSGRGGLTYSYFVPGQWQGRSTRPRVIGDSRAAGAIKRLARDSQLLGRLRSLMTGIDLRFVQVVRNPYDTIATMMLRRGRSFDNAFEEYFRNWDAVSAVRERLHPDELLVVRHEALLADPKGELRRLCSYLKVESEEGYLEACSAILYPSPSRSRDSVAWLPGQRARVEGRAATINELHGYSFDD
jgi:hypothetical protein